MTAVSPSKRRSAVIGAIGAALAVATALATGNLIAIVVTLVPLLVLAYLHRECSEDRFTLLAIGLYAPVALYLAAELYRRHGMSVDADLLPIGGLWSIFLPAVYVMTGSLAWRVADMREARGAATPTVSPREQFDATRLLCIEAGLAVGLAAIFLWGLFHR
jgi:hypothetical protein